MPSALILDTYAHYNIDRIRGTRAYTIGPGIQSLGNSLTE
jgi:hypothetical protein